MTRGADWRDDAACLHADPDLFFPAGPAGPALDQVDEAKRICGTCQVRKQCLAWALDLGAISGVWGGSSEEERLAMRRAATGDRDRDRDRDRKTAPAHK